MPNLKRNKTNWTAPERLSDLAEFRYQLRKFLSFSEGVSESRGIPAQQYQLLQVVAAVPAGQESSISYIAERMMVRHNSAVELVDRAVKAGLVIRVVDETDHRRSVVEMTEKGRTVLERLVEELRKLLRVDATDCYLLDSERGVLRCVAVNGFDESLVGFEFDADKGVAALAVQRERPVAADAYDEFENQVPHEAYRDFAHALVAEVGEVGVVHLHVGAAGGGERNMVAGARMERAQSDGPPGRGRFSQTTILRLDGGHGCLGARCLRP